MSTALTPMPATLTGRYFSDPDRLDERKLDGVGPRRDEDPDDVVRETPREVRR